MSPLWTRTGSGTAKDPLSFIGSRSSLPCWLQVTSSVHQPPSRLEFFHCHHHPHNRCARHSSQDGDMLQIAPPAKILHAFELSLQWQTIRLHDRRSLGAQIPWIQCPSFLLSHQKAEVSTQVQQLCPPNTTTHFTTTHTTKSPQIFCLPKARPGLYSGLNCHCGI